MKKLVKKFIYNQKGMAGPTVFIGALFAVFTVIMLTIAIPMMQDTHALMSFQTALSILKQHDYVAYGAPTGDWTTLGDLYTQDIYPQADDTYDIGATGNRYQNIYSPIGRPATFTLAATNATVASKAQADYICDYINDQTELTAAIAALPAIGGTIYLSEGNYLLEGNIDINKPVRLIGSGPGTIVDTTDSIEIKINSSNVEIAYINFNIQTSTVKVNRFIYVPNGVTSNYVNIHHNRFIARVLSGNPYPDSQNADSTIVKCIETGKGEDWVISNNFFKNQSNEGVSIGVDYNAVYDHPTRIIVTDNTFWGGNGIVIEGGGTDCVIDGNTIYAQHGDDTGFGVYLLYNLYSNVISNNVIYCDRWGVVLSGSAGGTAFRNTIEGNNIYVRNFGDVNAAGISIQDNARYNRIINNDIISMGRYGIVTELTKTGNEDNEIIGNRVTAYYYDGIYLETRQIVKDNFVYNCDRCGIRLASGSGGSRIIGNVVDANSNQGIYVLHGNNADDTLITYIEDNTIQDTSPWDSTTIDGAHGAGASVIAVDDPEVFEINQHIQTNPTGFAVENHRIIAIDYHDTVKTVTVTPVLTNDHLNGDPIYGRQVATSGISVHANAQYNVITGNNIQVTIPTTAVSITIPDGNNSNVFNNSGEDTINVMRKVKMKNTSGGALADGDIVIIKAVAAGNEVTTTAVLGDDTVYGMVTEAMANNAWGLIQIEGKVTTLNFSVDQGAVNIGDFLCTNNVAKEAALAGAGDMAFAIALEAAAGDAVLDALLIEPRKL